MHTYSWQQLGSWLDEKISPTEFSEQLSSIAVDSRDVEPGSLFFALSGAKTDGHNFLHEASKKGALAAVVSREYRGDCFGLRLFYVDNTLDTLQMLAKKWLSLSSAKIIAVTGSLGKTTTKGFLYQLLKQKFKVTMASGNKNSQIGLALALLNETKGDEEYLVLEMGMTHAGNIQRLIEIAPPHIALVTSIALVHAENFDSLEDIARAKAEIFSSPQLELAIINKDTQCASLLFQSASCSVKGYSKSDFTVTQEAIRWSEGEEKYALPFIQFPAEHVYENFFASITCAQMLGMTVDEIKAACMTLTLPEKRLQEIEKKGVFFVNDSYNAAEESMKGALDMLAKKQTPHRKIAVLGAMRELGKFSDECHKRVNGYALKSADCIFYLGENWVSCVDTWGDAGVPAHHFLDLDALMKELRKEVSTGDHVLVKGSKYFELWKVIENF